MKKNFTMGWERKERKHMIIRVSLDPLEKAYQDWPVKMEEWTDEGESSIFPPRMYIKIRRLIGKAKLRGRFCFITMNPKTKEKFFLIVKKEKALSMGVPEKAISDFLDPFYDSL